MHFLVYFCNQSTISRNQQQDLNCIAHALYFHTEVVWSNVPRRKSGVPHCSAAMWNPPTTPWGTFNENSCFLDVYYFISDLHITFLPCTRTGLIFPRFYWGIHLLYELRIPPMPTAPYNVSQTSAARFLSVWQAKEVEWKNCSPAHCGHMAREESSRSGARRPQSGIFVVCFPLCCSLSRSAARPASALSLSHPQIQKLVLSTIS